MNPELQCSTCGAALDPGSLSGLCPRCLLGLGAQTEAAGPRTSAPGGLRLRYLGDYELLDEIARGGMGVVYRARQVSLNRVVAVKMVLAGALASQEAVRRFLAEAEAAANLQHPNIVAIHEVGQHEGQHYFSMDYVEGKNLADLVANGPLPPERAAAYVKVVAEAIHFAHQRGTLHRDLKPQNVLIDANDQPRVTDFGLARPLQGAGALTETGTVMGTPGYMSPEQALGQLDRLGPHSDVYSLGAVLYELFTGKPPFPGASPAAILMHTVEREPVRPRRHNANLPVDAETICLKCLEKRPERRYPSARALAEDLGRLLEHRPVLARRASLSRRLWSWLLHHPWAVSAATALALVALMVAAYGLWSENEYLAWRQSHPDHVRRVGDRTLRSREMQELCYPLWVLLIFVATDFDRRRRALRWGQALDLRLMSNYRSAAGHAVSVTSRCIYLSIGLFGIGYAASTLARSIDAKVWEGQGFLMNGMGLLLCFVSGIAIGVQLLHYQFSVLRGTESSSVPSFWLWSKAAPLDGKPLAAIVCGQLALLACGWQLLDDRWHQTLAAYGSGIGFALMMLSMRTGRWSRLLLAALAYGMLNSTVNALLFGRDRPQDTNLLYHIPWLVGGVITTSLLSVHAVRSPRLTVSAGASARRS